MLLALAKMARLVAATRLDNDITESDPPTDVASALSQLCEPAERLEPPHKKRRISNNETTDKNESHGYITLSDIDIELVRLSNRIELPCTDCFHRPRPIPPPPPINSPITARPSLSSWTEKESSELSMGDNHQTLMLLSSWRSHDERTRPPLASPYC